MFSDGELLEKPCRGMRCGDHRYSYREGPLYRRIEGNDNVFCRFAVLPNIEDQKYTLGTKFTSREEQGEFIFWDDDNNAEITVVNSKFWIKPLEGSSVLINETKIPAKIPTELKFGDTIFIGAKLWFQKRELDQDAWSGQRDEKEEEIVPFLPSSSKRPNFYDDDLTVCQNPLILSLIMSYLPVRHLKRIRLVSRVWNEEAFRILRKGCHVDFIFVDPNNHYTYPNNSMKFFQYMIEMKSNPLQNWILHLPSFDDFAESSEDKKLVLDLDWFLPMDHGHLVKKLELGEGIKCKFDFDLRMKILHRLQATLEELTLSGQMGQSNGEFPCVFSSSIEFNKLQKFTMAMHIFTRNQDHHDKNTKLMWIKPFQQAFRGVGSIRITSGFFPPFFLHDLGSYANLEEIGLHSMTPERARLLRNTIFAKPLKKIELGYVSKINFQEDLADFEAFIGNHSKTLECLQFTIEVSKEIKTPLVIHLPGLPRLKVLNVKLYKGFGREENLPETVEFPSHAGQYQINYAIHLPRIQSLTLRTTEDDIQDIQRHWNTRATFYNSFFPNRQDDEEESSQICKTLQFLDVEYEDEYGHVFSRAAELATLFPNVFNKWLNAERAPPEMVVKQIFEPVKKEQTKSRLPTHSMTLRKRTSDNNLASSSGVKESTKKGRMV